LRAGEQGVRPQKAGYSISQLVTEVLTALAAGDPDRAADGIRLAVSFFEHARGRTEHLDRPEVTAHPADPADLSRLRKGLVDFVRAGAPSPIAGAAVFALGKLYDPTLTEFFVAVLRDHLHADAHVLYQAMIALHNLDVEVFAGRRSMSVRAEAENRALAAEFLGWYGTGGDPEA
jgi:hypothetical protein